MQPNLTERKIEPTESAAYVQWEETACLLCGSERWMPLVEAPDWACDHKQGLIFLVVQCLECGLCFTNPRPNAHSIAAFYGPDYRPHQKADHKKRVRRSSLRRYKEHNPLPEYGRNRLLDFGCGSGKFLAQMHELGWQVTGLDLNEQATRRINDTSGLTALNGTLPHPALAPESFDRITMRHALEHVHNPAKTLSEANRLLRSGGQLSVLVPNIDSLSFRRFGHAWFGLDLPRHLTHFTPLTLELLLYRNGFAHQSTRMIRHSNWIRQSARIAMNQTSGKQRFRWYRSKIGSELSTWYACWTGQSECIQMVAVKEPKRRNITRR